MCIRDSRLAVGALYHGGYHIGLVERSLLQGVIGRQMGGRPVAQPPRFARHRGKRQKPVPAVDPQVLGNRADAVRGIVVSVAMQIVVEAIMPVFPPEADLLPQVMQIAAGAVDNLPENPSLIIWRTAISSRP